jgi:hypothetical protein
MAVEDEKRLLVRDVTSTIGGGRAVDVSGRIDQAWDAAWPFEVAWRRESDAARVQRAVDDVQQFLHDTFVDTTWPACPRHLNHPLWFRDGSWWCEADGVAIAKLGELKGGA